MLERVLAGDIRAISRLITLSENGSEEARKITAELFKHAGRAQVIGVTGPPGAGKSTLVDQLAAEAKAAGGKVAILAIDPTSPFSGGAILGDRIRMTHSGEDGSIFIRSMATRGSLGGLSRATFDAVQILDASGFDTIFVETVGVGQAEVDIVRTADTCLVILVPGMGDAVQAIKAGILEIADLFVINKADRDGADLLERDLHTLISLADLPANGWRPRIIRTIATQNTGVAEVMEKVAKHREWAGNSDAALKRRSQIMEHNIVRLAMDTVEHAARTVHPELLAKLTSDCVARKTDPYAAAGELMKALK